MRSHTIQHQHGAQDVSAGVDEFDAVQVWREARRVEEERVGRRDIAVEEPWMSRAVAVEEDFVLSQGGDVRAIYPVFRFSIRFPRRGQSTERYQVPVITVKKRMTQMKTGIWTWTPKTSRPWTRICRGTNGGRRRA